MVEIIKSSLEGLSRETSIEVEQKELSSDIGEMKNPV